MEKIILVTGASSGLGYYLTNILAKRGNIVYACGRNSENLKKFSHKNIITRKMDVQKQDEIDTVVNEIIQKHKKIDVLYANAGYGEYGSIELTQTKDVINQFDVNVFGVDRTIKSVLPHMRSEKNGHIVITSSLVSNISLPFSGWYCSSKFAVKSMATSLRMEVEDFGIQVVCIEPGPVRSSFHDTAFGNMRGNTTNKIYKLEEKYAKFLLSKNKKMPNAKTTLEDMLRAGLLPKPKNVYRTTSSAKILPLIKNILGEDIFYRFLKKMIVLVK